MKAPRSSDSPQRKPRRRWRWHVPPAILHGPETLEGTQVLDEVKGEIGLLLWQSLRDVTLWSSIDPPEKREALFAATAGERRRALLGHAEEAGVGEPMQLLARLVEDPAKAEPEEVMGACREVSEWAEAEGLLATALAFAQAAALASPRTGAAGLRVGKLARKKGEDARAETWFRRTIGLSRQGKDWASYAEAFIALGNLYVRRGSLPVARHLHIRGLRAARRHSLRELQAGALHDLFGIALELGEAREAEAHARAAFDAYGPEHPRVPMLAHDVAYFWMTLGHFEPSLAVFQALLPEIRKPSARICVVGDIARAAGGAGERETFERAQAQLEELLREPESGEYAARALLELAHGAASLGEWSTAEQAARQAQELAGERQEAQVREVAQGILEAIQGERAVETARAGGERVQREEIDALAADFVRSLTEHSAAG